MNEGLMGTSRRQLLQRNRCRQLQRTRCSSKTQQQSNKRHAGPSQTYGYLRMSPLCPPTVIVCKTDYVKAFSLSFVLGKQPADPDSLTIDELLVLLPPPPNLSTDRKSQNQYYLIILRTQHLLTTASPTVSIHDLWSLWLLRAECLRLLQAPRLAALELTRITVPSTARIPWDFQVLKILLIGMASGRWLAAVNEWYSVAAESRVCLARASERDKDLWKGRLTRLEELVAYGLIEARVPCP